MQQVRKKTLGGEMVFLLLSFSVLFICSIYDLYKKQLPLYLIFLSASFSMVYSIISVFAEEESILSILLSLAPGLLMVAISLISMRSVGLGDGLLLIATGPVFGFGNLISAMMLAFFLSAVVSIFLLILKKADRKTGIPFIPFLACSMGVISFVQI